MEKDNLAKMRMRIESLLRQRELLEKKKIFVFNAVGTLKRYLKEGKISKDAYDAEISALSPRELIISYNERIGEINNELDRDSLYIKDKEKGLVEKEKITAPIILVLLMFSILGLGLFFSGTLTGLVFKEKLTSYSEQLNLSISESYSYNLTVPEGELRSLAISGRLLGSGNARAYIEKKGKRYLVLDTSALKAGDRQDLITGASIADIIEGIETSSRESNLVTGAAIADVIEGIEGGQPKPDKVLPAESRAEEPSGRQILINLSYKSGTVFDVNDDGIESIKSAIDFTVESTKFSWDVNTSNLCTRWETYSIETSNSEVVCNGAEGCCSIVELAPKLDEWNATFHSYYGRFGATYDNTISAQVLYIDIKASEQAFATDIFHSDWSSLRARFVEMEEEIAETEVQPAENITENATGEALEETAVLSFSNICIDSCLIEGLKDTSYNILIEVDNATLEISSINYTTVVIEEVDIEAPIITIISPQEEAYNTTLIGLNFSINEEAADIWYVLNNQDKVIITENTSITAAEGNSTLTLYATDLAGNTGYDEVNFSVIPQIGNITVNITQNITNITNETTANITLKLKSGKKEFEIDEDAVFNVSIASKERKSERDDARASGLRKGLNKVELTTGILKAEAFVRENNGPEEELINVDVEILEKADDEFEFKLAKKREIHAGLYTLKAEFVNKETGEVTYYEQNFTWGVLAVNTNKATYTTGDNAFIGIAVLDDGGAMVCNASVTLEITAPSGIKNVLSTENGLITVSPTCAIYNITELPDYYADYAVSEEGDYVMNLTASTYNGERTLVDKFYSEQKPEFDVERDGPTRTYPPADYSMEFTIKANRAYKGEITESIPASFSLIEQEPDYILAEDENEKILIWNVNLRKDEEIKLNYKFNTPPLSPYLFILGPLKIGSFEEKRSWMIASDKKYTYTDKQLTPNSTTVNEGIDVRVQTTHNVNIANGNSNGNIDLKLRAVSGANNYSIGTDCDEGRPFKYLSSAFRNCSSATLTCSDDGSGNITATDTSGSNGNEQFEVNWTLQSCLNSGGKTYTIWITRTDASTATSTLDDTATITVNNGVTSNLTIKTPLNATFNNSVFINFTFNATTDDDFGKCRLWHNYSAWAANDTNLTAVLNNTEHGIKIGFDNDYHIEWNVECNDSVGAANFSYANYTLYIDTTKPKVNLTGPENATTFADGTGLTFNFTFVENANETCELWGNFTGTWLMNQTLHRNVTPTDSAGAIVKNRFATRINVGFGEYIWNVRCNDSAGNKQFNYTWPEKNNSNFTFFVAGAANNKPLIENVTILPEGYTTDRTVTPVENGTIRVVVQFNVTDADGTSDLSATTARANLSYRSIARYNDTGNCFTRVISTNVLEVNCTISLYYYDNASALWGVNVSIADAAGEVAQNQSNGAWLQMPNVTVNTLSAFQVMQNAVTFGSASAGQQNMEASFIVNNTGNDPFNFINITAYDLNNSDSTSFFRISGNFSVNATQNAGGRGRALINRTQVPVPIAGINASLPIRDQTSNSGLQTIYIYVDIPINLLETSTVYNSTPPGWEVRVQN